MVGKPLTTAEQIAGYLKLTRLHYYLVGRDDTRLCLELRSLLSKEMSYETLLLAAQIKALIGGKYDGVAA